MRFRRCFQPACVVLGCFACLVVSCQSDEELSPDSSGGTTAEEAPASEPAETAEEETGDAPEYMPGVQQEPFGEVDGRTVHRYLLTNEEGMQVSLINWGATVTGVRVPDKDGRLANVTLGFEDMEGYRKNPPYFGAICGRYANRIAAGRFTLNGTEYTLTTNDGEHHLHGGETGFNRRFWTAQRTTDTNDGSGGVRFHYVSPDGEQGYPGKLEATVIYSLTDDNALRIDYTAVSDKPTPVNLTNHCYWNLGGAGSGDVLDHVLMLNCPKYLPVDDELIPTGTIAPVDETPMDFTQPATIGSRIEEVSGGYDHCYVIGDGEGSQEPALAARVRDPETGRVMEVFTTEPGVQLYTGNFLDGSAENGGFAQYGALCLECQHFPDSPNRPDFPDTILEPGEVYRQTTVYRFSVDEGDEPSRGTGQAGR